MPFYRSFQVNEPVKTEPQRKTTPIPEISTSSDEPVLPVQNIVPLNQDTQAPTSDPNRQSQVQTQQPSPSPAQPSRFPADMSTASFGGLRVSVGSIADNFPIENATIQISETIGNTTTLIDEINTTAAGQTNIIELPAPPREYSEEAGSPRPYAEYNLTIRAEGYEPVQIIGTEVLPDITALQRVQLLPQVPTDASSAETFVIPDHTLYGIYPPKIAEEEVKEITGSGEIVLSRVVIPEFIVVHDGSPNDASAQNYYVRYRDYIKNVASSEIYATWPESTLYANILAIQSFTLNRVYTEW